MLSASALFAVLILLQLIHNAAPRVGPWNRCRYVRCPKDECCDPYGEEKNRCEPCGDDLFEKSTTTAPKTDAPETAAPDTPATVRHS